MLKVKIFSPGKTKERWLVEALNEYEKRLSNDLSIEWIYSWDSLAKIKHYLCLAPQGSLFSSKAFSEFLYTRFREEKARLHIVIGEADGIPKQILSQASHIVSLSPLTFTHQMTRLILLEQLYRAVQIEKGSKYHK